MKAFILNDMILCESVVLIMFLSIKRILFSWKVGRHDQHVEAGTASVGNVPIRVLVTQRLPALRVGGSTQGQRSRESVYVS